MKNVLYCLYFIGCECANKSSVGVIPNCIAFETGQLGGELLEVTKADSYATVKDITVFNM